MGELRLEGVVAPLLPLLPVAEQIHIGKQTSFGLGRVRLELEAAKPLRGGEMSRSWSDKTEYG